MGKQLEPVAPPTKKLYHLPDQLREPLVWCATLLRSNVGSPRWVSLRFVRSGDPRAGLILQRNVFIYVCPIRVGLECFLHTMRKCCRTFSFKALVKHILDSLLAGFQGVLTPSFSIVRSKYHYFSFLASQRSKMRHFYNDGPVWKNKKKRNYTSRALSLHAKLHTSFSECEDYLESLCCTRRRRIFTTKSDQTNTT